MGFNYEAERQSFNYEVPKNFNLARNLVEDNIAKGLGDKVAVIWENHKGDVRQLTYSDLARLSNQFGNALKNLGVKFGDRLLFRTPNLPEFMVAFLGAVKIGAVPIPSSTLFREPEVAYRINDSGAVAVVTSAAYVAAVDNVKAECPGLKHIIVIGEAKEGHISYDQIMAAASEQLDIADTDAEDYSFMMYTSGTTGNPKAAAHAQRYVIGHDPISKYWQAYQPGDIVSHSGELNWIFTLCNNFMLPLRYGLTVILYQGGPRFEPEKWFELFEKYKISNFAATPTVYRMLLTVPDAEKKYDISSLKHCISAGEPLPSDTYEEFKRRFGVELHDGIGQTEVMVFVSNLRGMPIKPGSCGRPQPGRECRILDENGNDVKPGETGVLVINMKDPGLMKDYWNKPEKTAEVFIDGWYYTGDVVEMDEDGYYWFKGRNDDLIKASGYRISPFEVESALASHPAVLESAAVESPDEMRGNVVKAFIVLKEGFQPSDKLVEEIQNHVKVTAAPYKYPRLVDFVKELPKTQSGKIKRKELRTAEFAKAGK